MVDLPGLLRRVLGDLDDLGVGHALVGGLAVSVRTEPRFTRDVDLAMAVEDDDAAEQVVAALGARGWRLVEALEQEDADRLAAARFSDGTSSIGPVVDLLFASSGVEDEVVSRAEVLEVLPGIRVPVATAADLVVLKLLSVSDERLQDEQDLRALVAVLTTADVEAARDAAALVMRRGYGRGRDILATFDQRLQDRGHRS